MMTRPRFQNASTGLIGVFLLFCLGLSPGLAAAADVDDILLEQVNQTGSVRVQVELAAPTEADQAEEIDRTAEDVLFALPLGSYQGVEREAGSARMSLQVDAAGLGGLLASSEVMDVALAGPAEPLWPLGVATTAYAPNRILVKFRSELNEAQVNGVLATAYDVPAWLEPEQKFFSTWVVSVASAAASIPEIVDAVQRLPNVAYAEPDYRVSILARPNDPSFGSLWGLENRGQTGGTSGADIGAVAAWDLTTGDPGTVVAVIDTGVDYTHPDLGANMWVNTAELNGLPGVDDDGNGYIDDIHGINTITGSGQPMDDHSHGTHCAGTIGAIGNNGVGVTGVSWRTKIMALKFLSSSGSGYTSDAVEALSYATMMKTRYGVNVKVTSNSWGGGGYSQSLKDAIQASNNAGMLFIASAGNDTRNNETSPSYPASYDNAGLIAVASSDHNDGLSWFSNYGLISVDLAAPGSSIFSTLPNNRYGTYSGTSMAGPHVAGAAALLWAYDPSLSTTAVKTRLLQTVDAKPAFAGRMVSGGRLNVYAALMGGSSAPTAPTNLTATAVSSGQINLAWADNSSNEQGFRIERRHNTGNWTVIATVGQNATGYANIELRSGTTYYYRVAAYNAVGTSASSNESAATTTGTTPCQAATIPITVGSTVSGALSTTDCFADLVRPGGYYRDNYGFQAIAGRTYRIDLTSSAFDTYLNLLAATGSGILASDDDGGVGTNSRILYRATSTRDVRIQVTSYRAGATGGYVLSLIEDQTSTIPSAPSNLTATVNSQSKITLRWSDRSTNERGFRIERRTGTGAWTQIGQVGANITAYASIGLSAGTTYSYRVLAHNTSGVSAYSNTVSATTQGGSVAKPAAPTSLVARAASNRRVNLTWRDNANNEAGYRIERKIGTAAWVQIATVPANTTSYANIGLTPNTSYTYRVRAFNAGGASVYATATAVKTPR